MCAAGVPYWQPAEIFLLPRADTKFWIGDRKPVPKGVNRKLPKPKATDLSLFRCACVFARFMSAASTFQMFLLCWCFMLCTKFAQTKASSRLEPVLAEANSAKKARKGTAEAIYKLKLAARGSYSLTGEGLPSGPPHTGIKTTAQLSEVFSALGAKLSGQDGQRDRDTAGTMRAVPIRGTVQDYERALCCTYVELRLLAPWQLGGVCFSTDTKVVRIDLRCGSIEDGQWAAVPNASSRDFPTHLVLADNPGARERQLHRIRGLSIVRAAWPQPKTAGGLAFHQRAHRALRHGS